MQRLLRLTPVLLGLAAAFSGSASGQTSAVPALISYQSRVTDAAGNLIGSPTPVNRMALFRIYDSAGGAARLYSEQQTVTIANGEFSILLGTGTQIGTDTGNTFSTFNAAIFGGATRFLGVTIDDGDGNPFNDPEMSPRQQLATTPFAFRSAVAESVALGGVNGLSLANNSVGTAAIAPGAITAEKIAPGAIPTNSVDGTRIVDGSIGLADLSPAVVGVMPKPSVIYNQGLGVWTRNGTGNEFMVFPIDVSDLGVDGEVMVSYDGFRKDTGAPFSGRLRLKTINFGPTAPFTGTATTGGIFGFSSSLSTTAAAVAAPTANIPFFAFHESSSARQSYAVSGNLAPATASGITTNGHLATIGPASVTFISGSERSDSFTALYPNLTAASLHGYDRFLFPPKVGQVSIGFDTQTGAFVNSTTSSPSATLPLASYQINGPRSQITWAATQLTHQWDTIPLFYIYSYYPGALLQGLAAPYNTNIANVPGGTTSAGAPQTLSVTSIQTGVNRLTITVANTPAMQIGDNVTISGVTGAPAVNASYTVAAVPSPTTFEVTAANAAGPYSGGTITHTLTFNRYRLWVAVHALAHASVTVSDK